jgi:hypothetical protein
VTQQNYGIDIRGLANSGKLELQYSEFGLGGGLSYAGGQVRAWGARVPANLLLLLRIKLKTQLALSCAALLNTTHVLLVLGADPTCVCTLTDAAAPAVGTDPVRGGSAALLWGVWPLHKVQGPLGHPCQRCLQAQLLLQGDGLAGRPQHQDTPVSALRLLLGGGSSWVVQLVAGV